MVIDSSANIIKESNATLSIRDLRNDRQYSLPYLDVHWLLGPWGGTLKRPGSNPCIL